MKLEEEKKKQIIAQGQPTAQQQVYLAWCFGDPLEWQANAAL